MANSTLTLTGLDFDELKTSLRDFLRSQDQFNDFDFEGSNMSVLLDVLSYNTYKNAFYLNMVFSELFLDSAQRYSSVASRSKELNYVPQSKKSSEAVIDMTISTTGITSGIIVIPAETLFSGTNANGIFTFTTPKTLTFTSSNSTFLASNVHVFEGQYVQDSFIFSSSTSNPRFPLSNEDIDIDSLSVNVVENAGQSNTRYDRVDTLYNLDSSSPVFFVQCRDHGKYEILFGDGILGKKPLNGSTVIARYRTCSGPDADGCTQFALMQDLGPINNGIVDVTESDITTVETSSFGSEIESIESVRFRAPRWYATQQRGVSSDDYTALIMSKFGSSIQDAITYGGERVEPKQYGSVVVSAKPFNGTRISQSKQDEILGFLEDKTQMRVLFQDPEYVNLTISSTVQYDPAFSTQAPQTLENTVSDSILSWSKLNLEKFGNDFRYSRFVSYVDSIDSSIISNETVVKLSKRLYPSTSGVFSSSFSFKNALVSHAESTVPTEYWTTEPVVSSSSFTYNTSSGTKTLCFIRDDLKGKLIIYRYTNDVFEVINESAGVINYDTGAISLVNLTVADYDLYLSIFAKPRSSDIIADKNTILIVQGDDISVSVTRKVQ